MAVCGARAFSLLVLGLVGCSGAASSDLFANATADTETLPTESEPTEVAEASAPSEAPDGSTPTPTPTPTPKDAGVDAPPQVPTCTPEAEPNNDMNLATTFTTSFCGKIGGSNDTDYGRFVIPVGATKVTISHAEKDGKVTYRYWLLGAQVDEVKAIPGATYNVQIKRAQNTSSSDRPTYQLDVSFK